MNKSQELLSSIVIYDKYAKYIPELKRRETWEEIVDRYIDMMYKRYPQEEIRQLIDSYKGLIYNKRVLPSMRALQFAGAAIEANEARLYNCAYLPISTIESFSETMFLLLGGSGVGYSVQKHHVDQLPVVEFNPETYTYTPEDSIEGWAECVRVLMEWAFNGAKEPYFNLSGIRPKGSRLVTAGGKAPGPEPLEYCLDKIRMILLNVEGRKITPLETHDIVCHIADAVLAGGIRRAALISLFSPEDTEMVICKSGQWWEDNPQRGRSNNSAVFVRGETTEQEFKKFWKYVEDSGSGEPGIYWTNNRDMGTNPCCEIGLLAHQFCNLTEINGGMSVNFRVFIRQSIAAALFGTLQAGFTDFKYLRSTWKSTTELEALIGVGITGIANGEVLKFSDRQLKYAVEKIKYINGFVSNKIGINSAARLTTIKPSGTTSCVVGTSSGIHAWHDNYYIRRMQCKVGSDMYNHFTENHPEIIKIMQNDPSSAVVEIPQAAPLNGITREDEDSWQLFERVMFFNKNWVREGHQRGDNTNNVSATINIKDEDWTKMGQSLWDNKDNYNGISVFPYFGGTYKDAPFESIDKEEYEKRAAYIEANPIDMSLIVEDDDNTERSLTIACSGGKCEL